MTRQGWFSDIDPEEPENATHRWQPCLQLDGMCLSIQTWHATKEDCDEFIRSEILGKPMLDDTP